MFIKNPTQSSEIRLNHAQEIAAACPISLFAEIALTGSSARGIANDHSDIEINFWIEEIPALEARQNWLIELGVENITAHTRARPDGSIWINGTYKGIELEAGWQRFSDLEHSLNELINAETTDHKKLCLAELVLSAKSLRGSGTLNHWQPILANYPETLADKLIDDALSAWLNEDDWLETRLASNDYTSDLSCIYRILFALNQQWEINWKWAYHLLPELEMIPNQLLEIVGERHRALPMIALDTCFNLIQATLALIDPTIPKRNQVINKFHNIQNQNLL